MSVNAGFVALYARRFSRSGGVALNTMGTEDKAAPDDEDGEEAYAEGIATRAFTVFTTKEGVRFMSDKKLSVHANVATFVATVQVKAGFTAVCKARASPAAAVVPPQIPAAQTLSEDEAAPEVEDDDEATRRAIAGAPGA